MQIGDEEQWKAEAARFLMGKAGLLIWRISFCILNMYS